MRKIIYFLCLHWHRLLSRLVVAYVREQLVRDVHLPVSGEFVVYFDSYADRRKVCHCERMQR